MRNELIEDGCGWLTVGPSLDAEQGKGLNGELREVAENSGGARIHAAGGDLRREAVDEGVDGGGSAKVLGELGGQMREAGLASPSAGPSLGRGRRLGWCGWGSCHGGFTFLRD